MKRPSSTLAHARRLRADKRFRWYGRAALLFSAVLLALLLGLLLVRGLPGFLQVQARFAVPVKAESLNITAARPLADVPPSQFGQLVRDAVRARFPEAQSLEDRRELQALFASQVAGLALYRRIQANPHLIGETLDVWVPASALLDGEWKHGDVFTKHSALTERQTQWVASLARQEAVRTVLNRWLVTSGDSRSPEKAGFLGAALGSLWTLLVCMGVAFPLGVASAVYMQEFARPGRWMDWIEININNLAAVPSIVFGLLGLAVYLNVFGLPRGSAVVAGLTLALMILPVIILTTRAALRAVPDSIRQAALALGASKVQAVWHHTLPLALPGIMTGTILGIARALGETAPLLMIGMVAFIADVPSGPMDSATVLPVQIYLWAGSPEAGFVEKTASAILALLAVLMALNALAIYIRRRFEVRW